LDYAAPRIIIHYTPVFDGRPTVCGVSTTPRPSSNEWCHVTCTACLRHAPPVVHARQSADARALCAAPPGEGRWTTRRRAVTCAGCRDEIARRLAL
jgi:hypothetical protein